MHQGCFLYHKQVILFSELCVTTQLKHRREQYTNNPYY